MKKTLAILIGSMLITGAFAACGGNSSSSDKEDTTKSSGSALVSNNGADEIVSGTDEETEPTDADTSEAATAETTTKAQKTTEKATTTERPSETQPASDDIPEIDPSLLKGGDLIGSWKTDFSDEYEDFNMEIIFKPNGKASASLDISDELSFKNGKAVFDGTPVAYEFDGRVISISIEDYEFIKLERTSGSGDSLDGTYKVVIDENSALNDLDYYEGAALVIKGESVYALYEDMYVYTTSGNQLEMYIAEDEDHDTEKVTYGVIGDKLYVYADGETSVFTRTDH